MGLAVGLEKMGKMGLLGASARSDRNVFEPSGRYGSVMSVEGRVGTTLMPGVFAQAGMEYAGRERRRRLRAVRQGGREEPRALDAEPAGAVPEGSSRSTR